MGERTEGPIKSLAPEGIFSSALSSRRVGEDVKELLTALRSACQCCCIRKVPIRRTLVSPKLRNKDFMQKEDGTTQKLRSTIRKIRNSRELPKGSKVTLLIALKITSLRNSQYREFC